MNDCVEKRREEERNGQRNAVQGSSATRWCNKVVLPVGKVRTRSTPLHSLLQKEGEKEEKGRAREKKEGRKEGSYKILKKHCYFTPYYTTLHHTT